MYLRNLGNLMYLRNLRNLGNLMYLSEHDVNLDDDVFKKIESFMQNKESE